MSVDKTVAWLQKRATDLREIASRSSKAERCVSCLEEANRCEDAANLILKLANRGNEYNGMYDFVSYHGHVPPYSEIPKTASESVLEWARDMHRSLFRKIIKRS